MGASGIDSSKRTWGVSGKERPLICPKHISANENDAREVVRLAA